MQAYELNLDGLVGPTHNYAGLSFGNLASSSHRATVSSPKAAALQGLAKMKRLTDLGLLQAVLPPQERPDVRALRAWGFTGDNDAAIIARAAREAPGLLAVACSASSMWAANAATVSPSGDCADGRIHFTPANMVSHLHRAIEADAAGHALRTIFNDSDHFAHHPPLTRAAVLGDEGAANHTRLCADNGAPGVEWFVYGQHALDAAVARPRRFPVRQTYEASCALARLHQLDPTRTLFAQQHPDAIDAGVFHNDVIAVGNRNVLLIHECALASQSKAVDDLRRSFEATCGDALIVIQVSASELTVEEAVATYVFNSQLVTLGDGSMALVCPTEASEHARAAAALDRIVADNSNPITQLIAVDTRQSMANGGGPACLRLRVVINDAERAVMHQGVLLTDELHARLVTWVQQHYRDSLSPKELADPKLLDENRSALDELTTLLHLGDAFYPFQR